MSTKINELEGKTIKFYSKEITVKEVDYNRVPPVYMGGDFDKVKVKEGYIADTTITLELKVATPGELSMSGAGGIAAIILNILANVEWGENKALYITLPENL